jgi:hypothetical protein
MATKAQQNDDGTVSDSVTKENQKGYANYEAENAKKQREMETKDAKFKESVKSGVEKVRGFIGMKAGGKVSSASKRADGCAVKGKTKGRML